MLDEKKIAEEISYLRRKIDSLSSTILDMKTDDGAFRSNQGSSRQLGSVPFDPARFIDINTFNEFKKVYIKDKDNIDFSIDIGRKRVDELMDLVKERALESDLKRLEEILLNKLDELRQYCTKRFAEKSDTNKNFKYIEAQVNE